MEGTTIPEIPLKWLNFAVPNINVCGQHFSSTARVCLEQARYRCGSVNLNFTLSIDNMLLNERSFWRGRNEFWTSRPLLMDSSSNFKPEMVYWVIFWRGRFGAFFWSLAELLRKSQIHKGWLKVCKIKCTPLHSCYIEIYGEIIATDKTILLPASYKKPGSFCKQMSGTLVAINRDHDNSPVTWIIL